MWYHSAASRQRLCRAKALLQGCAWLPEQHCARVLLSLVVWWENFKG